MKNLIKAAIVAAAILCSASVASAQSLKDIFNSTTVRDVVTQVTGVDLNQFIPTDIHGNWTFNGLATRMDGDDALKTAASAAAAPVLNQKLNKGLEKVGLKKGAMDMTFNADSTFTFALKGKTFPGTYSLNGNNITLKFGQQLQLFKIKGTIIKGTDKLDILFPADKALEMVKKLTSNTKNAALQGVGTAVQQYDGMRLGMGLAPKQ